MSATHTPGPWFITDRDELTAEVHSEKGGYICTPDGATVSEQIDNALLIAAAPDLLEALKQCLAASFDGPLPDYARESAAAAIAKATGEGEA